MTGFTLEALMGVNQSFEKFQNSPSKWKRISTTASYYQVNSSTTVHSSTYGLKILVNSPGFDEHLIQYPYYKTGSGLEKWFPDFSSHAFNCQFWARGGTSVSSGVYCKTAIGLASIGGCFGTR